jgi:hypothetical protein
MCSVKACEIAFRDACSRDSGRAQRLIETTAAIA